VPAWGETVSSWLSGNAKAVGAEQLERALGSDTINSIASNVGLSFSTAASALGFMLPKLIQTPGDVVPSRLPFEFMS